MYPPLLTYQININHMMYQCGCKILQTDAMNRVRQLISLMNKTVTYREKGFMQIIPPNWGVSLRTTCRVPIKLI